MWCTRDRSIQSKCMLWDARMGGGKMCFPGHIFQIQENLYEVGRMMARDFTGSTASTKSLTASWSGEHTTSARFPLCWCRSPVRMGRSDGLGWTGRRGRQDAGNMVKLRLLKISTNRLFYYCNFPSSWNTLVKFWHMSDKTERESQKFITKLWLVKCNELMIHVHIECF